MRLTCPNCAAQYEIDGVMIPPPGRDVQCSNCGHTWFQLAETETVTEAEVGPGPPEPPPAPAAAEAAEPEPAPAGGPGPGGVGVGAPTAPPRAAAGDGGEEADEPEPLWPDVGTDAATAAPGGARPDVAEPAGAAPRRPPLDRAVMELLRQEAEREAAARRAEARAAIESQPELGLASPPPRAAETVVERSADRAGMDPAKAAAAETVAALAARPRRATLPDVEEINSSLAGRGGAGPGPVETGGAEVAERRRGFRTGFLAMLLVVVLLILAYTQSQRLAAAWPAAAPAIGAFVRTIDAGRIWLDDAARRASETIRGLSAGGDAPP